MNKETSDFPTEHAWTSQTDVFSATTSAAEKEKDFPTQYAWTSQTNVFSTTTSAAEKEREEEKEKIQYYIAKPTRRYLRGSISKNED